MVHYGPDRQTAEDGPSLCPKCGSHRTQIVGRLEDGKTLIVRCNACGAHSTILPGSADETAGGWFGSEAFPWVR
jgi:hypothetical protein